MGVNFGLFQPTGLENDTGLLRDRWGQDGSEHKQFYYDGGAGSSTVYTVTTGKVLYINTIFIGGADDSGAGINLKDGGAGGDVIIQAFRPRILSEYVQIDLPTPIKFETDVYSGTSQAGDADVTLIGWEEEA